MSFMAPQTERMRGWFMGGGGVGFIERQGFPGRAWVWLAGFMWFIIWETKKGKTIALLEKYKRAVH